MDEDDLDFTPTQGTSSLLASLFSHSKNSQRGNSSLTYTAPKPPKKDASPSKNQESEEKSNKGVIIISKAVQAYKLEHRKYINQGVSGIVISGCYNSHMYAIVLYKPSKEHLSKTTITKNFSVTLSANNYVSFYDNNKQNWSVMFQSAEDVELFVEKIAISKFYCHPECTDTILTQDLMPPSGTQAYNNSTLDIFYSCYRLTQDSLSLIKDEIKERIKLSDANTSLAKGLVGSFEKGKRIVIVPHPLSGPLINELAGNKDLLLKVKVEKIISELERSLMEAKSTGDTDSPLDSSAEETSIKARGASIKEALVNTKAQKANLISRMARMGQATLPLKQGVGGGISDSEEEISVISSSPKPRMSKNRSASSNIHPNISTQSSQFSNFDMSKQLSVYSANELAWQNQQLGKVGVGYQQLIPVTASPVSTPITDPSVSVYVSESRVQAAELRMGISKITEKVDLVLDKIQSLTSLGNENQMPQASHLDSSGIISSIKNLITENEHLKGQVEEQKKKIEQQNDRIFHLLDLNHKYLEKNSASREQQSETETKLRQEMELHSKKEIQLEMDNKNHVEKIKHLEEEVEKSALAKNKLEAIVEKLSNELNVCKSNTQDKKDLKAVLDSYEEELSKASATITGYKEKLEEAWSEKEELMAAAETQKEELRKSQNEIKTFQLKAEEYGKSVKNLTDKMIQEKNKSEAEISNFAKLVEKLEEEKKKLLLEVEKTKLNQKNEIEKQLRQICSLLSTEIMLQKEYTGPVVLSIIEKIFNEVISEHNIKSKNNAQEPRPAFQFFKPEGLHELPIPVPTPRTAHHNVEVSNAEDKKSVAKNIRDVTETKEKKEDDCKVEEEKKEAKGAEKEIKSESQKNEKTDSRYKTYDQGWRTIKPPPPPLFDDDDEEEEEGEDWLN